jgi:putative membrane protein
MPTNSSNERNRSGKEWFKTAFAWTGTALPLCYPRILLMVGFSILVELIYKGEVFFRLYPEPVSEGSELDSFGHVVLGSLIGFLLVMRMNSSNSRYWEGRTHWGTIINTSRNLARAASLYTKEGEYFADLVAGFAISLKLALRGSRDLAEAAPFLPESLVRVADNFGNQPTAIAAAMTAWVRKNSVDGVINPEMTRHFEVQIAELINAQGGCEKIQKTPLPFAYVSLIKLLILAYLVTLPLVICERFGWWSPVLMAVLSLGMFGMEETSVEIEDPFGTNPNCLDLDVLTITITRDVGQLSHFSDALVSAAPGPINSY